jgi:hypothetical protein
MDPSAERSQADGDLDDESTAPTDSAELNLSIEPTGKIDLGAKFTGRNAHDIGVVAALLLIAVGPVAIFSAGTSAGVPFWCSLLASLAQIFASVVIVHLLRRRRP